LDKTLGLKTQNRIPIKLVDIDIPVAAKSAVSFRKSNEFGISFIDASKVMMFRSNEHE
jgi:hypothetical protein